jgi:hypothetical protein
MTEKTAEPTYRLGYEIRVYDPPKTEAEVKAQGPGFGGTDAVVVHNIIFGEDGSRSEMILSRDSRTGEPLDGDELFKCFTSLAYELKDSEDLGPGRREVCRRVWELVREAALAGRRAAEGGGE